MIQCGGIFLPDGEEHFVEWMTRRDHWVKGKLTYQYHKLEASLLFCKDFRNAVDIGAHVGLWSMHLAPVFQMVYAFEPVAAHRECFERNVPYGNVTLTPCALGDHEGFVSIRSAPTSSGDSRVAGDGDIPLRRLDEYELQDVDLLKVDCEGYELFCLRGAEQTILRCRPTICVEQKPGMAQRYGLGETDAVRWLKERGATMRERISGDYILTFDDE